MAISVKCKRDVEATVEAPLPLPVCLVAQREAGAVAALPLHIMKTLMLRRKCGSSLQHRDLRQNAEFSSGGCILPGRWAEVQCGAPGPSRESVNLEGGTWGEGTCRSGTTAVSGFALNLKLLTTTGAVGAGTSTAAITTATTSSAPPVMTYAQLESLINKWSLELEDQEKHFLHQATQVNAWDRTLIENGEKEIVVFVIDLRQLAFSACSVESPPLCDSTSPGAGPAYLPALVRRVILVAQGWCDQEQVSRSYKLAENIDAQLKCMAQDLKDITEHLNTSRGPADTSDPLQQICKILNAHMDSLQWIDQNSAVLQRKVEEVTKVCESRRKEQERSFRIAFD
ncbi:nuclear pore glycoprotein p62-like [Rhynochetos jubatus]